MSEKYKKINRQYVLSDSSVNEYGFRLLTSGYQLESFQKNPIGYYMHRREDGIVLKREDLQIDDDKIVGTPVINLSNNRGEQTFDEAENGFLNAASVGHIVVLEYSTDPELMLPGQTGPTITKWYNKECSLVDIPGNCNALTRLYDEQENEINLPDLGTHGPAIPVPPANALKELYLVFNIDGQANGETLLDAAKNLVLKTECMQAEIQQLLADKGSLRQQLDELADERNKATITLLLDTALEDRKITVALKNKLAADYANNADGLKELLAAMPSYRSISELLNNRQHDKGETQWQWDDYEKNDPSGKKLKELRANDPVRYKELFDKKFSAAA